jgi:formamidopyrimidine-DNA glycosylase
MTRNQRPLDLILKHQIISLTPVEFPIISNSLKRISVATILQNLSLQHLSLQPRSLLFLILPEAFETSYKMPEIAEIARIVHFIRKNLVGKTLAKVTATDDPNVYGKVGTSAAEFQKHMTGKKILDAGQQGKYFWMVMSSPPHPVMHFGMTGWLKMKGEETYYYRKKEGDTDKEEEWPPKYWKFNLETEDPKIQAAFVDFRRFARIRLVDCDAKDLRKTSPLVENGPDPVKAKCKSKKVPIKAMLLDQAVISGIGNWVGDEIMYDAKMHPEQYCNTLSDEQISQLHKSIHYVCGTAVDLLADSEQFPDTWLFKHRWGKGKKDASNTLPNGHKIAFLTVGGRTSAVIPALQKKTGPVAKEMDEAVEEEKPKKAAKKRKAEVEVEEVEEEEDATPKPKSKKKAKADVEKDVKPAAKKAKASKQDVTKKEAEDEDEHMPPTNGHLNGTAKKSNGVKKEPKNDPAKPKDTASVEAGIGRRRSGRQSRT